MDEQMTRRDLVSFMREQRLAVQASVTPEGNPQAAVVGFVVSGQLEVFFDTSRHSRKVANLRHSPKIALVIGGLIPGDERTLQYEGLADEPAGNDLKRLKELYFASFPDGRAREQWPDITYIRTRPTWLRYSDFNQDPPLTIDLDQTRLAALD